MEFKPRDYYDSFEELMQHFLEVKEKLLEQEDDNNFLIMCQCEPLFIEVEKKIKKIKDKDTTGKTENQIFHEIFMTNWTNWKNPTVPNFDRVV